MSSFVLNFTEKKVCDSEMKKVEFYFTTPIARAGVPNPVVRKYSVAFFVVATCERMELEVGTREVKSTL